MKLSAGSWLRHKCRVTRAVWLCKIVPLCYAQVYTTGEQFKRLYTDVFGWAGNEEATTVDYLAWLVSGFAYFNTPIYYFPKVCLSSNWSRYIQAIANQLQSSNLCDSPLWAVMRLWRGEIGPRQWEPKHTETDWQAASSASMCKTKPGRRSLRSCQCRRCALVSAITGGTASRSTKAYAHFRNTDIKARIWGCHEWFFFFKMMC